MTEITITPITDADSSFNPGYILARKIFSCYPDGFNSFFIVGKRGIGKSSYCLKAMYQCYRKLGFNHTESWAKSLASIQFSLQEVVDYLEAAIEEDRRQVVMCWDDCRIHASSQMYFSNYRLVQKLGGLLDSIRSSLCCMLMTAPSTTGILNIILYDDYLVKVIHSPKGGWYRFAVGYIWNSLPSGKRLIYKKFQDEYSCYLPADIYQRYMVRRKAALSTALSDVNKLLESDANVNK